MTKNKILTTLNQSLKAFLLNLLESDGVTPQGIDVLEGVPIGTSDNTANGELAVKVITIGDRSTSNVDILTALNQLVPAKNAVAVSPSDSVDLTTPTRALFIGTGGTTLKVAMLSGDVTFTNVPNGTTLLIVVTRVYTTGTNASDIVALW